MALLTWQQPVLKRNCDISISNIGNFSLQCIVSLQLLIHIINIFITIVQPIINSLEDSHYWYIIKCLCTCTLCPINLGHFHLCSTITFYWPSSSSCVSIPLQPQLPVWVQQSHHHLPNHVVFEFFSSLLLVNSQIPNNYHRRRW